MTPIFTSSELAPTVADKPPGPPPRPKLRGPERRHDRGRWATVVPPTLAVQVAGSEPLERHRALVERVDAAAAKARELEAAHAQAVEKDRAAEVGFAQGERRKLPAPAGPDAEAAVAQARRELDLLEQELPASAKALFAAAYPHLEAALRELEARLDADDQRVEAAIGEALRVLDERAQLAREAGWIGRAMWESSVSPFDTRTPAVSSTPVAAEFRAALARLRHEREETARRRRERLIELEMHFNPDRSPKRPDGRSLGERRREAEQRVRERLELEAAS
jgi:hypothetical protein